MTKRKVKFSEDTGTEEVENSAAKSRRFKVKEHVSDGQWIEVHPHPTLSNFFNCDKCEDTLDGKVAPMKHFHLCSHTNTDNSQNEKSHNKKSIKQEGDAPNTSEGTETKHRGGADTRRKYTNIEKLQILTEVNEGGKPTIVAHKYGINRSLISKWMSTKEILLKACSNPDKAKDTKNRRKFKYEQLYEQLHVKYLQARESGVEVTHRWVYNSANAINKEKNPDSGVLPPSVASNFTKQYNIQLPKKIKTEKVKNENEATVADGSRIGELPSSQEQVPLSFAINLKNDYSDPQTKASNDMSNEQPIDVVGTITTTLPVVS